MKIEVVVEECSGHAPDRTILHMLAIDGPWHLRLMVLDRQETHARDTFNFRSLGVLRFH